MYWTVKVLKRDENNPNDIEPKWVPIDPETPQYETQFAALAAAETYKREHPQARVKAERGYFQE